MNEDKLQKLKKEVELLKLKRAKEQEEARLKKELFELKHPNITNYQKNVGNNLKLMKNQIIEKAKQKPNKPKKSKKKQKDPYSIFDF